MAQTAETLATTRPAAPPAPGPSSVNLVPAENLMKRMEELYDKIAKRAFQIFESNGRNFGHELDDWFQAESELFRPVKVNISEADGNLTVRAEVPGFAPKELDVALEPTRLTITGKRERRQERKDETTSYTEARSEQILKVVDLPSPIDTDKATATLQNGILELKAPKATAPKKLQILPKDA